MFIRLVPLIALVDTTLDHRAKVRGFRIADRSPQEILVISHSHM